METRHNEYSKEEPFGPLGLHWLTVISFVQYSDTTKFLRVIVTHYKDRLRSSNDGKRRGEESMSLKKSIKRNHKS